MQGSSDNSLACRGHLTTADGQIPNGRARLLRFKLPTWPPLVYRSPNPVPLPWGNYTVIALLRKLGKRLLAVSFIFYLHNVTRLYHWCHMIHILWYTTDVTWYTTMSHDIPLMSHDIPLMSHDIPLMSHDTPLCHTDVTWYTTTSHWCHMIHQSHDTPLRHMIYHWCHMIRHYVTRYTTLFAYVHGCCGH